MKIELAIDSNNIQQVNSEICNKLKELNYETYKRAEHEIEFYRKETYKYRTMNMGVPLSRLHALNTGLIVLKKSYSRVNLIGEIDISLSFIFFALMLFSSLALFITQFDFDSTLIPTIYFPLLGLGYFIYYLIVKKFIKDLVKL